MLRFRERIHIWPTQIHIYKKNSFIKNNCNLLHTKPVRFYIDVANNIA